MRKVSLYSLEDYERELTKTINAYEQKRLITTGKWKPGQIIGHLASWIEYGYEGYPTKKPSFPIRWVLRLGFRRMLKVGMKPGGRVPGTRTGTVGDDDIPFEIASNRLTRAIERLKSGETALHEMPEFGPMSHTDFIKLNLRHAELHLSFLQFQENPLHPMNR